MDDKAIEFIERVKTFYFDKTMCGTLINIGISTIVLLLVKHRLLSIISSFGVYVILSGFLWYYSIKRFKKYKDSIKLIENGDK